YRSCYRLGHARRAQKVRTSHKIDAVGVDFSHKGLALGLHRGYSLNMDTRRTALTPAAIVNLAETASAIAVREIAKSPIRAEAVLIALRGGVRARICANQVDVVMGAILVMVENRLVA